jgi:hypothetical protein
MYASGTGRQPPDPVAKLFRKRRYERPGKHRSVRLPAPRAEKAFASGTGR